VPNPFAPGREVVLARVDGALLSSLGVRHGDHVALERADRAEHGDLAAVVDASGRAALWRVYPEGDALRLSTGDPAQSRRTAPHPRVQGVVVGVLRRFAAKEA
jgi:SOS-response transcriptional repressor LexA